MKADRSPITAPIAGDVLAHKRTSRWGVDVTRFNVTRRSEDAVWFTVDDGSYEIRLDVQEWARRRAGCEVISVGRESGREEL